MPDTEFIVNIGFKTNAEGAKQAAAAIQQIKQNATGAAVGIAKSTSEVNKIKESLGALNQVALRMGIIGTALTGGIAKAANDYVKSAGTSTAISRQWLATTQQLEYSYYRIGKVATDVLLPYMQQAASLADKAAGYIEKNPGVVQAGLGVGTTLGGIGLGAGALSVGISTYNNIAKLFGGGAAAAEAGGATEGATNATVAVTGLGSALVDVIPPLIIFAGILAGLKIGGQAAADWGKAQGIGYNKTLTPAQLADINKSQYPALAAAVVQGVNQGTITQQNMPAAYAQGIKAGVPGTDWGATGRGLTTPPIDDIDALLKIGGKAYLQYAKQELYAAQDLNTQKQKMERDFNIQVRYQTQDFQKQQFRSLRDFNLQQSYNIEDYQKTRYRSLRDFNMQVSFSEQDYYRQRTIANRDFNIQMARAEQDYQISRSRASEDHQFDLFQIALSGDAMQYWLSQRQFNIDQSRAAQDYTRQQSRSQQDSLYSSKIRLLSSILAGAGAATVCHPASRPGAGFQYYPR